MPGEQEGMNLAVFRAEGQSWMGEWWCLCVLFCCFVRAIPPVRDTVRSSSALPRERLALNEVDMDMVDRNCQLCFGGYLQ